MIRHIILYLVIAITAAAFPAASNDQAPSHSVLFNGSDPSLGLNASYSCGITFHYQLMDSTPFNMVSLLTAISMSHLDLDALIHSRYFNFGEYPGCVIQIRNLGGPQPLTPRIVYYSLYSAVRAAAIQPTYTETSLTAFWNGHAVGYVDWRQHLQPNAENAANETTSTGVDRLVINDESASFPAVNTSTSHNDLAVHTSFSSGVELTSKGVFLLLMMASVHIIDLIRPIRHELPITLPSGVALAKIELSDMDHKPFAPFITKKGALRTFGIIAEWYLRQVGWRETMSDTFLNDVRIMTTMIRAWGPLPPATEAAKDVA